MVFEFKKSACRKAPRTSPLKRRGRAKHHGTKTLAPSEATITQLTSTVEDHHLFNSSTHKKHKYL